MTTPPSAPLVLQHVASDPTWPQALVLLTVWALMGAGGVGWSRALFPGFRGPERALAGMAVGWSLPGVAVTAGLAANWDLRGTGVTLLWVAPLAVGLALLFRKGRSQAWDEGTDSGVAGRLFPVLTACIVGVLWARLVWPEPWGGTSGEGIYGYRAKLWMLTGGQPAGYESAPGYDFSYPSYPPCFSGVVFAGSLATGRIQDHWGALFPVLPGAAVVWCASRRLWLSGVGMAGCAAVAALAACQPVTRTVTWFYPEPVLAAGLLCAAGFFSAALTENARRFALGGGVVLAFLCWWKNDGLVYWLSGALWLGAARPTGWLRALLMTAPVALGWRLWLMARAGSDPDFDFLQPWINGASGSLERLAAVGGAFWREALVEGRDFAFVWWWGPVVLLAVGLGQKNVVKRVLPGVFLASSVTVGLSLAFLFSVLPVSHHLMIYWRLLAAPSWLLLVTAGGLFLRRGRRQGFD